MLTYSPQSPPRSPPRKLRICSVRPFRLQQSILQKLQRLGDGFQANLSQLGALFFVPRWRSDWGRLATDQRLELSQRFVARLEERHDAAEGVLRIRQQQVTTHTTDPLDRPRVWVVGDEVGPIGVIAEMTTFPGFASG